MELNLFADAFKNNFIDPERNSDAVNEFTRKHNELLMSTDNSIVELNVNKIEAAVHMLSLSEAVELPRL